MSTQILIIEDEPQIRENLADLLALNDFEVATASNGREGISQALLCPPDLILCDVRMPEVDGYQVLEVVRSTRSLATVPFIFLTAKTEEGDVRQGMVLGADDYLTKPFTVDNLLAAIDSRLKREALRKTDLQAKLESHRHTISQLSSHEYNTPLSGIIGFVSLLQENYSAFDEGDALSMLGMVKTSALRLKRSLDNQRLIEVLQQMDDRNPSYPFFSTGTAPLTAELVEQHLLAAQKRQEKEVACQLTVEPGNLNISPGNLGTVLTEVLDNALKFSDGTQPIDVTGRPEETTYRLTVTNCGQIFRAEDIDRIAPYVQFDRLQYEQQGLGLGLSITKKLLAFNGGSLEIDSDSAGKTTVSMILPVV